MWLLGFESAGYRGGAGLGRDGQVVSARYIEGRGVFARHLVELAQALIAEADITPADLAAVAVGIGPGSLTGLRIGLSAAAGLAYAIGRPAVPLGNLEILAFKHRRPGTEIAPWLQAGAERIYYALYRAAAGDIAETVAPKCGSPESALGELGQPALTVLGGGASRHEPLIRARHPQATVELDDLGLVEAMVELGFIRLDQGCGIAPERLQPLYLRDLDLQRP
ncbi:MAG TPA: tRNA (adenosine(37)-N6)-threonylcarbamoyltransferase complex dimerization subunit type 1 TsaB [Acidobacteriota bacterium]